MNWLKKMMYGRYGGDQLSLVLMGLYLVLYLLAGLPNLWWLSLVGLVCGFFAIFRMLSRNLPKRQAENAKLLQLIAPVLSWWRALRARSKDRDHRYFKCPNCGQQLRVPKGKGKITITCRNCGVSFEEKS